MKPAPPAPADITAAWERHKGLVFFSAQKLAQKFGGSREDYLGHLFLRFARCVASFDPARGIAFSSYFSGRLIGEFRQRQGRPLGQLPEHHDQAAPVANDVAEEQLEQVWNAMTILSPRHAVVIEQRLQGATLQEIADDLGISRERVRQIEGKAIVRLRRELGADQGDQHPRE